VEDLGALEDPYYGRVSILALDRAGRHGGFCNEAGSTYLVQIPEMAEPQELPRVHVPAERPSAADAPPSRDALT
jgi:hypothetical protein